MKSLPHILILVFATLSSCGTQKGKQHEPEALETTTALSIEESVLQFAQYVLGDDLHMAVHQRVPMNYWDVQMIFEANDWKSDHFKNYTTFANTPHLDKRGDRNYTEVILFMVPFKDIPSAQHAFDAIKGSSQIRIKDLEGLAGLLVEQVQIYERIRMSGGLLTLKDNYVFYLVESCENPPIGDSWENYEHLFLSSIGAPRETMEVVNADCGVDEMAIATMKVRKLAFK